MSPDLLETLRQAQRFGFFGSRDVAAAAEHARSFVDAIGPLPAGSRLLDLGSGGGLPGLVLADAYPEISVMLVDRRQKRTDFLERAVRRHGWEHVTVRAADARILVAEVAAGQAEPFDVVTARGFGPPELTLRIGVAVVRRDGRVVISDPPTGDRWPASLLAELGLVAERCGRVSVFHRRAA